MPDSLTVVMATPPGTSDVPFIWSSVVVPLLAALIGALAGPYLASRWQLASWRTQRLSDLKYDVFRGAVQALAAWASDALDPKLQSEKSSYKGSSRLVEMRASTAENLAYYDALLRAFFTEAAAERYSEATKAPISIENVPNQTFEARRIAAICVMADEVDFRPKRSGS